MFRVLEKPKVNKLKVSKILNFIIIFLTLFVVVFFLATIFFWYIDFHKDVVFKVTGGLYLFSILFKIIHHNFFQQKKAVFIGELEFRNNEIEILNEIYALENISTIRIKVNDIKEEFLGLISQGINNELFIHLQNGDELNYFFEQNETTNLKTILVLKEYVAKGKLPQSNYNSIMDNTNYY